MLKEENRNKYCWLCGKLANSKHHLEPIFERKYNSKIIPLCRDCHNFIESIKESIGICQGQRKLSLTRFKKILRTYEQFKIIKTKFYN